MEDSLGNPKEIPLTIVEKLGHSTVFFGINLFDLQLVHHLSHNGPAQTKPPDIETDTDIARLPES